MSHPSLSNLTAEVLRRLGPDAPLHDLPLATRIKSALSAMGVENLRDAAEISARALLLRDAFGKQNLHQLQAALQVHGLSLRNDASFDLSRPLPSDDGHEAVEALVDGGDLQTELAGVLERAGLDARGVASLGRALGFDGRGTRHTAQDERHDETIDGDAIAHLHARVAKRLALAPCETPVLRRALAAIADLSPCTFEAASRRIHELGLSTVPFEMSGLLAAAELVGVVPRFVIETSRPAIVTTPYRTDIVAEVLAAIGRIQAERSIVRVEEVVGEIGPSNRRERWFEIVGAVVDARPELEWVDRQLRLFAGTGVLEGLGERVRKILAVATQVTLSEVIEALLLDRRLCGLELPRDAVVRVCQSLEGVQLQGDVLTRVVPADLRVLTPAEQTALDVIRQRGTIVQMAELVTALEAAGFGEIEVRSVLSSPILTKVGRGRYGLRGWGFDFGAGGAAASRTTRPVEREARGSLEEIEREAREAALVQVFRERPETTLQELLEGAEALRTATVMELARAAVQASAQPSTTGRSAQTRTRGPRGEAQRYLQDVAGALQAGGGGLSLEEVRAKVGGSQAQVRRVLRRLEDEGRISRSGSTRWTVYRWIG